MDILLDRLDKRMHFTDYYIEICTEEIELFIMEAKYTTFFNRNVLNLVKELNKDGRIDIDFCIDFNEKQEIVTVDSEIVAKYIADFFMVKMCNSSSKEELDSLIEAIKISDNKTQKDFFNKAFVVTYEAMREVYENIMFRKKIFEIMSHEVHLENYNEFDRGIYILSMIIINKLMVYLNIEKANMQNITETLKKSHDFFNTKQHQTT